MKRQELSEVIEEGINRSINSIGKSILYGVLISIAFLMVFVFIISPYWSQYKSNKCSKEGNCQIYSSQQPIICNYPYIDCKIYEEHHYFKCEGKVYPASVYIETKNSNISGIYQFNETCEDVSNQIPLITNNVCGYSESNEWFKQFKENYEGAFRLKMECK